MSWYTNNSVLIQSDGDKDWWRKEYSSGDPVPVSGIYRCLGCKREITCNNGDLFPPQDHHLHATNRGAMRWKLNVKTNTKDE